MIGIRKGYNQSQEEEETGQAKLKLEL